MTEVSCSLRPDEQRARCLSLRALAARASARETTGIALTLTFQPDYEAELLAVAEAEAACCPFLALEVRRSGDVVELRVSGPPEARELVEAMFG